MKTTFVQKTHTLCYKPEVAGLISNGFIGNFSVDIILPAVGSTHLLRQMNTL